MRLASTYLLTRDRHFQVSAKRLIVAMSMCGDYNGVIGMEKTEPMRRFITGMAKGRFSPAEGPATLSGLFVETDDRTGKAQAVKMIRHGGLLEASAP